MFDRDGQLISISTRPEAGGASTLAERSPVGGGLRWVVEVDYVDLALGTVYELERRMLLGG